jgi:nifR3 family TIM-barrel protein
MYLKPIKIGKLEVNNNVFLAPMAGVTDMPYRKLCKEFGAGLVYTEMVSSKAIEYGSEKTINICEVFDWEHPVGIQLFGSDPRIMADTAKKVSEFADIIDINMGCPANKIVKNGEGSALMKNPKLAGEIIKEVVQASVVPVTVKIRKGWNDSSVNAIEIAQIAEDMGASLITVHGRTREEFYSGKSDLNIIKKVKESVSIPVIGNGDITSPETAKIMFEETNCDGIMIGRASQGNPWIFERIITYLRDDILLPEVSPKQKIDMALTHLKMLIDYKGEHRGICEMRKNLFSYIKNFPNATELRNRISTYDKYEDIENLLKNLV